MATSIQDMKKRFEQKIKEQEVGNNIFKQKKQTTHVPQYKTKLVTPSDETVVALQKKMAEEEEKRSDEIKKRVLPVRRCEAKGLI